MYEDYDTPPSDYIGVGIGAMEADRPPGTWKNTDWKSSWADDWHRRQAGFPEPLSPDHSRSPAGTRWPAWRALFRPDGAPRYHHVASTSGNVPSMGAYGEGYQSVRPVWAPINGNTFPQWPWLGPQASPAPTAKGRRETISGQPVRLGPGPGTVVKDPRLMALQSRAAMHDPSDWNDRRTVHDIE
jgi:hypothetical protein